ncbi:efflux RND transporter periplasmic adaptor subunit [Candidatus Obscuribacterales bacterium]|nr:efflux RND transporter periplasmic adaptor subunit [Candidatus Obscuribacterales bacterium]
MLAPNQVQNYRGSVDETQTSKSWAVTIGVVLLCALATIFLWQSLQSRKGPEPGASETVSLPEAAPSNLISLDAQTRIDSGVTVLPVMATAPAADIVIPGVVEPNQEQLQQITPLVSGRVGRIAVALGDQVRKGDLLVTIDSPQVAELHGKLHEANTRAKLARQNMERVTQSANKVALLKSKATLEETEASLNRISQLVNEGLSARKDLVAAEAEYERAKADFNFQKDISLNREVAEARATLSTAQTEVEHIKDELRALDAPLPNESNGRHHDISAIELHAPMSGTVIERLANPGAGFEANKPLLTLANTKRLWVIASVPEGKIGSITLGMPARISFDGRTLEGKVNYIDPRLNEDTRTGRVRVEIANDDNKVKVGSFVEVAFSPAGTVSGTFVPSESIQTVGDRSVVFVEKNENDFEPRDVVVGKQYGTLVAIKSGLSSGERIAGKGAFLLKSKLLKNQLGED